MPNSDSATPATRAPSAVGADLSSALPAQRSGPPDRFVAAVDPSGPAIGSTTAGHAAMFVMRKLPVVTPLFWTLKIAIVTLGEAGGDQLAITLKLGYLLTAVVFVAVFALVCLCQVRARRLHPTLYWAAILSTSLLGTEIADGLDRGWLATSRQIGQGIGYATGAMVLTAILAGIFVAWARSGQTYDVESITTHRGETLYWTAILVSNTVGTAFADWLSYATGLGFEHTFWIITGALVTLLGLYWFSRLSPTLLFWAAFILTRPLGTAASDSLSKPTSNGGAGWGTLWAVVALLGVVVTLTACHSYLVWRFPLELLPMPVDRLTGEPLRPNGLLVPAKAAQAGTGRHQANTTPTGPTTARRAGQPGRDTTRNRRDRPQRHTRAVR